MPRVDIRLTVFGCEIYRENEIIGSVEKLGETVFEASNAGQQVKEFTSLEAAIQWIVDPEHPLIESM